MKIDVVCVRKEQQPGSNPFGLTPVQAWELKNAELKKVAVWESPDKKLPSGAGLLITLPDGNQALIKVPAAALAHIGWHVARFLEETGEQAEALISAEPLNCGDPKCKSCGKQVN